MVKDNNVYTLVQKFIDFIENEFNPEEATLTRLSAYLDQLSFLRHEIDFDESLLSGKEAPSFQDDEVLKNIEKNFPIPTLYNCVLDMDPRIEKLETSIGDAADDVYDIYTDLKEFLWLFENINKNDAYWHYIFSFNSHWGSHLRNLQLYIHISLRDGAYLKV
jgi:hypothetical protein